ncbi:protein TIFY 9-like [Mercurialis annua]|uniref:protein TIFY 9-like n=1 Tax=Mercurialis annua TaxID=3986 RepID=UPI0024AEE0A0|nr:protein TIFY 9-like [Mercurialis annua]
MQSKSNGKTSSSAGQLTIFYEGEINVYDNVTSNKAQAVMRLARESSMSRPISREQSKTELKETTDLKLNCKLQSEAEPPIARKPSLQQFLEKRHRRITCKNPYYTPRAQQDQESAIKRTDKNHSVISLSPFPSRLDYIFIGKQYTKN